MEKDIENLNLLLADLSVFYIKVQRFHWLINGKHFFMLHEKFQETYEKCQSVIDLIAERIIQLNQIPFATISEFLKNARIKEMKENAVIDEKNSVNEIIADLNFFKDQAKKILQKLDKEDYTTADILTGFLKEIEKDIWMYSALTK